jgi:hypothetical protein
MKASTVFLAFLAVTLVAATFFGMGFYCGGGFQKPEPTVIVDTLVIHDTIKLVETKPAGTIVVKLPVHDTLWRCKTDTLVIRDSIQVDVPIEQRKYEGNNYTAVVKGFRPELVNIDVRCPVPVAPEVKRKWFAVTVGPQVGFGFTPKGWEPYAGIGITAGISF